MPTTPRRRSSLPTVLAALALGPSVGTSAFGMLAAQPPRAVSPRSALIADVRYDITFDSAHAAARRVGVRMTFTPRGPGPVVLALPAWTPGHYEIAYYARQVSNFAATGPSGRPLTWDKVDYQTWRVRPGGPGPVTVRFEAAADRLESGRSWARPDFLLLSGTTVFLYPVGRPLERYGATVRVNTAPGWRVATGMTPVRTTPGRGPHEWGEASYHDLVDMPFFVGRFDLDSVTVSGRWTRLATYPVGSVDGERRRRALDGLARAIPPEVAVFGEAPWRTYTAFQVADAEAGGGFGALEHQNSHVALVPGVRPGDRLLALGDVDVQSQGWREAFDRRYADRAGADLPIRVRRGADALTLAGRVAVVPHAVVRVVADPAASDRARRVRDGIFRGTSAP